jgi:hypothetical protein
MGDESLLFLLGNTSHPLLPPDTTLVEMEMVMREDRLDLCLDEVLSINIKWMCLSLGPFRRNRMSRIQPITPSRVSRQMGDSLLSLIPPLVLISNSRISHSIISPILILILKLKLKLNSLPSTRI